MAAKFSYADAWKNLNAAYNDLYGASGQYKISKIIDTQFAGDSNAFLESYFVKVPTDANGKSFAYMFRGEYNQAQAALGEIGGNIGEVANSNTVGSLSGNGSISGDVLLDVTKDAQGKTHISTGARSLATGTKAAGNFVLKEVIPAVAAVSTAISVGKIIDKTLYDSNPDFWDSLGMSTLNPETWNSITTGNDSAFAGAFNMIFGLNPETGNAQAYIDENAFAYLIGYMQSKGAFNVPEQYIDTTGIKDDQLVNPASNYPNRLPGLISSAYFTNGRNPRKYDTIPEGKYMYITSLNGERSVHWFDEDNGRLESVTMTDKNGDVLRYPISRSPKIVVDGKTYKYDTDSQYYPNSYISSDPVIILKNTSSNTVYDIIYLYTHGNVVDVESVEGLGNQKDSTQYDPAGTPTDIQSILNALKVQYPSLFENAIVNSTVDAKTGIQTDHIYLPVGTPNGVTSPTTDTQPTTNDKSQGNTQNNTIINGDGELSDETETLLDWLIPFITPPSTQNPPSTGEGVTPSVPPVTGKASALYSIYNPTLEQVNSLGAWLWSSNFIDQLLKLFSSPMDAIIGLHKIYATPATGGAKNIKVGYLDSGVPSKIVTEQYATIDCGTVNCYEYFGNVLDYNPYTSIRLYLPFIGIIDLSNSDVMRSSINVVYHVDVLSGACLAEVKITRDGGGGTLYQYAGNAANTLPISSGSYMGVISSVSSVATRALAGFASGGALGAVASGATGILNAQGTNVVHSGGFSGNAGAMGCKKPYLIIERPQTETANNTAKLMGYGSNLYTELNACKGFTTVKAVHVDTVTTATENEKDLIEQLLKKGVIIK